MRNSQGNVLLKNGRTYEPFDHEVREICLPRASNYALIVKDQYDGICCDTRDYSCPNWRQDKNCVGYYRMTVDGNEVVRGGEYIPREKRHVFNLQPHITTERDNEWLEAHNTRREKW